MHGDKRRSSYRQQSVLHTFAYGRWQLLCDEVWFDSGCALQTPMQRQRARQKHEAPLPGRFEHLHPSRAYTAPAVRLRAVAPRVEALATPARPRVERAPWCNCSTARHNAHGSILPSFHTFMHRQRTRPRATRPRGHVRLCAHPPCRPRRVEWASCQ